MGGGNIVDTILNTTEVRVLMDTSEYGGANRTLAFYFPYGDGLVEGFAYHPQEQIGSITDDPYSYVVSSIFYGNKFIHAIPAPVPPEIHDVAITNVAPFKTIVGQGYSLNINVTVENQGDYTETFNVTAYANTTTIETKEVTLTSGNSTTITFTWNTTGFAKGNYTISAYAWHVLGETDTTDNNYTDGWVMVAMVGDVNGDAKVDMIDIWLVARAYGRNLGDPEYEPNLDIDCNGKIDMIDLLIAAKNYGKTDP